MAVELYGTSACPYCELARKFLKRKGITYKEFDVDKSVKALDRMRELSGQLGVPVIVSGSPRTGVRVVVGYDADRITDILG